MAKFSTGIRDGMLGSSGFKEVMDGGFLKIYGGTVPADADAALGSATLLCTLSVNSTGTGLSFAAPAGGSISKASEIWSGVNVATGSGTFFRFVAAADDGTASTTAPRVQGTVSTTASGDMLLQSTAFVATETFTLNHFNVSLPTL